MTTAPKLFTLLIVDDEYDTVSALDTVLSLEGYLIRAAYNGRDALVAMGVTPTPDLVLSDIMMPYLDGYGFLKALRAMPAYARIPVILVSAGPLDESRVVRGTYDVFTAKPLDLHRLIPLIAELLNSPRRA